MYRACLSAHQARAGAKRVAAAKREHAEQVEQVDQPRLTTLAEDASQRRRRQTSRRQRKEHAVAMGALALLDSAQGAPPRSSGGSRGRCGSKGKACLGSSQ